MTTLKFTLEPLAPFATPLVGDTLFGHLCWAIREASGDRELGELLEGYLVGRPFLVVSDGFPAGLLPRPTAPDLVLGIKTEPRHRKRARTYCWLPTDGAGEPLARWMERLTDPKSMELVVLTQNTINRYTGTTGTDQFAPRQVDRIFFPLGVRLDVYAVIDEARFSAEALQCFLENVGLHGYGRDATTGLGKFAIASVSEQVWPDQGRRNRHWLTLAPCAPDAKTLSADGCYYLSLTRFGRHGNLAATLAAPFKRPLMMMASGALLTAREPVRWAVHGRGLGGKAAPLSKVVPETVHQGYAPVVPLQMESSP
jgi:CRISPR-associated protein Csm4